MKFNYSALCDIWGSGEKFTIKQMLEVLEALETEELGSDEKESYFKFFKELKVKAV